MPIAGARALPFRRYGPLLERAARLGPRDWALLAEAALTLLAVRLALSWASFDRLAGWVNRVRSTPSGQSDPEAVRRRVGRMAWAVDAAANHHMLPMRCLARSLSLARMLGRRGIQSELRLGVRKADERLVCHAWLEWGGEPVNGLHEPSKHYAPLEPVHSSSGNPSNA